MISAFTNTFKVPELRNRVIFTLLMLVVVRVGAAIACPGVNVSVLQYYFANISSKGGNGIAALFNLFSGGALENCAVFSLGVMPYISASIMLQLLTGVIPQLNKMQKEDGGRQKIMQYTRYATIGLCIFQGTLLAKSFEYPEKNPFLQGIGQAILHLGINLVQNPGIPFELMTVLTLTAGTMFLMWIGDQITDRGVGNGMSMIITVGIAARLPAALVQAWKTFVPSGGQSSQVNPMVLVLMIAFLVIVIASVIAVTQAQRKIPVQYAKRVVGRKVYAGGTQYMPLKVNYPGVMPIIFGQALLVFPASIATMIKSPWAQKIAAAISPSGSLYYLIYALMIFFFSYFWVAITFQPAQIADDLKKYGGYIPGVRPGKPTADFLDFSMTRLTFAGAIFLTVIAVLPQLLSHQLGVPQLTASFFGGTSLLIMVGVMLDTMKQVETHLIQRHYDGFLRKGRLRGGFGRTPAGRGEAVQQGVLVWACVAAAVLFVVGLSLFLATHLR
ncbi:MAG: preprotein translocase subunit SecY [Chthoniobacteraceae bacterium]|jgi:preprotein translocase subunit SecY